MSGVSGADQGCRSPPGFTPRQKVVNACQLPTHHSLLYLQHAAQCAASGGCDVPAIAIQHLINSDWPLEA
eukprot:3440456-Amphidinium_carterae.1